MLKSTPIMTYSIQNRTIYVKREDFCIDGPAFSKMRGVMSHLLNRPEKTIGVLDTYHSKAGWGVSMICKELKKQCIVFYPEYKNDKQLRYNQAMAFGEGAKLIPLQAGRSCILYHQAKKWLQNNCKENFYMMPNALKLQESIDETAKQVWSIPKEFFSNTTWIISISSGTIAAGVIKGILQYISNTNFCNEIPIYLHEGYSRPKNSVLNYIEKSVSLLVRGLNIQIIDEGYQYKDAIKCECPFPCNPYYDKKAWNWLINNLQNIKTKNILFWNIGA